jgi:hypothetical protein
MPSTVCAADIIAGFPLQCLKNPGRNLFLRLKIHVNALKEVERID